jgi:hypothetical protein
VYLPFSTGKDLRHSKTESSHYGLMAINSTSATYIWEPAKYL